MATMVMIAFLIAYALYNLYEHKKAANKQREEIARLEKELKNIQN